METTTIIADSKEIAMNLINNLVSSNHDFSYEGRINAITLPVSKEVAISYLKNKGFSPRDFEVQ